MALTHFRISQLPTRVTLNKTGGLTLNQAYPIAEENQLSISNGSGYKGEFLDFFQYEVSQDGTTFTNPAIVYVKELVDTNTPASANDTIAGAENTNYNLESNLGINSSTDRILITNLTGNGTLSLYGNPITIGATVFWHEFPDLDFDTEQGGLEPYEVITYQCGNHLGFDATDYTITVNVATLAQIASFSTSTENGSVNLPPTYNTVTQRDTAKITKGYIGGTATVQVVIASPMFLDSANNKVAIRYGTTELIKTADETFNITVNLSDIGDGYIDVDHYFVDVNGTTTSSVVTLTVTQINGDSGKVDVANDDVTFTANFN